ncbi:MAG: cyclic peptide export ABC transporter [Bacillota bacterium]
MKKSKAFFSFLVIIILMISVVMPGYTFAAEGKAQTMLTRSELDKIDEIVQKNMDEGKIPGVSLVIVSDDEIIYSNGFGYADVKDKINVTADTVFELGSNSKAFTGLAMLKLEKEGLVDLNNSIKKNIPWLKMNYNGEKAEITVAEVMNHTSGIPYKSIDRIPVDDSDTALEHTVKTLVGTELETSPGKIFNYVTIGYDILGFIIQEVSHESYETYIEENILKPIGLDNTYLFKQDVPPGKMAMGYKIGFLQAQAYDAPTYRGNKPAGYIMMNGNDMAIWLLTQLGFNAESTFDQSLIDRSHQYLQPSYNDDVSYMAGWYVNKQTGEVFHSGNNPNFSSNIILDTENGIGVAAMANLNSPFTSKITNEIMDILQNGEATITPTSDIYMQIDTLSVMIIAVAMLIVLLAIFFIVRFVKQVINQQRIYTSLSLKGIIGICLSVVFLGALGFFIYKLPELFFGGVSWRTVNVWAPQTIIYAVITAVVAIVLVYLYLIANTLFKRKEDRPYFFTAVMSIISGVGNALIIFMINTALMMKPGFYLHLLLFFIIGVIAYAGGTWIVRAKLIKITNQTVYKLRVQLINKILNTSYENIEKVEDGVIQSTLNNDTETVSNFANLLITLITNVVTLVCCFVYLGYISGIALLTSFITMVIIASIYYLALQSANKLFDEARTTQNVFFRFINDMNRGFKELRLNINRRKAFEKDIDNLSDIFRGKREKANLSLANVVVLGELVFTLAIGFIVFIFPIMFKGLQAVDIRSYVFILLYLTGPVNGILAIIPNLIQVKVSWNRVNKLLKDLSEISDKEEYADQKQEKTQQVNLTLKDVKYEYHLENGEKFKIGPINYEFNSGEIIFITGGNGSGKSTLAKVITGLYRPQSGEISINGQNIPVKNLEQEYSAIFVDFHLFDKLYGIDYESKKDEFQKYLDILQLSSKIEIKDSSFNTTKLSTGQRKRLALAISYLEDRPIYLFDEWAADQDPEFREFFYKELLPELKQNGKCVIVITHDDRYFNMADKLIKMEFGQIESYEKK